MLLVIVTFARVRVPPLETPAPLRLLRPPDIVRPEIAAVMPLETLKILKFGVPVAVLRCTVSRFAPGPLIEIDVGEVWERS